MRIVKFIIGWLCVVSLIAAAVFGGRWIYLRSAPFFRGAAVYQYDYVDLSPLRQTLASAGRTEAAKALRNYVTQENLPTRVRTGWDAVLWQLPFAFAPPRSSSPTIVVGAALLDRDGHLVAAYPEDLARRLPRYQTGDYGWQQSFRLLGKEYAPDDYTVDLYRIRAPSPQEELLGTVVVLRKMRWTFAVIPPAARVQGWMPEGRVGTVAVVALLAHWLLLVAWTAMDAAWRGMRPFPWGALVFLICWIGLLGYLVARLSPPGPCPNCGEQVLAKYRRCPACGAALSAACPVCRSPLKPGWRYCPACDGTPAERPNTESPPPAADLRTSGGRGRLVVNALNADTGAPIPNTRVFIRGPSAVEGLTDAAGAFEARRLRGGTYTVAAGPPMHEPAQVEVELSGSEEEPRVARLALRPAPGRLVGRVIERQSLTPVAGAHVYLDSLRADASALAGPDGLFALEGIPPGPYTVCAEAEGFAGQSAVVDIAPGRQVSTSLALDPAPPMAEVESTA